MDKKTLIGLGIIGVILAMFTFYNQPTKEELKEREAQQEQLDKDQTKAHQETENGSFMDSVSNSSVEDSLRNVIASNDSIKSAEGDSTLNPGVVKLAKVEEEDFVLENNNIKVILTNLGGGVKSVFLKKYQTYRKFIDNKGTDKIDPLQLFNEDKATNSLKFNDNGREINTDALAFEISKQTDNLISFIAHIDSDRTIEQIYTIQPDRYDIDYEVKMKGFEKEVEPGQVYLDWKLDLLKTERLLTEQRRYSTVFYYAKDSYDYLSEHSDDDAVAENNIDWVAFKQSYFSSILMPKNGFKKEGTTFDVKTIPEGAEGDSTIVKSYASTMNLGITNTANGSASMKWYFGPNDYELLKTYDNGTEDLLNYGWGLFRWINVLVIQPIFEWLVNFGMNLGLAILLLTVIIKLFLTPIQWKMYVSSAKMKILKPEIEEINEKYPNKSDAMAKQSETMALYRESGASPLSGCLPMLIQMPILFAVFRFFPSTFALRQQGFLWAEDLSSYDSVMDLSFHIPFYGSHVSLFTLLMAATTLIYTVLNSSNQMQSSQPGMPNMKIIMYFFPFMMIFFFNNYASGLSFYYFISTLMSILTMVAIKKFFVDEEKLKAKMSERQKAKQKGGKKGKSKFQERLEEMQKAQQVKLKDKKKKK